MRRRLRHAGAKVSVTEDAGASIASLVSQLYPICRSITGGGVRLTLDLLGKRLPLERFEVPTGARIFDWEVPDEWNVDGARLMDCDGQVLVDFRNNNLHLMSYSVPVSSSVTLEELSGHLHSIPERPDWIPYRTSYYRRNWAICLPDRLRKSLRPSTYRVEIETSLAPGSLSLAECRIPGKSPSEFVFFTHTCHPSLANDNCSGMSIAAHLAEWLASTPRRLSYRIVMAPGTIGSLCWLKQNEGRLARIQGGLVIGLLGDDRPLSYKASRKGDALIDRLVPMVIRELEADARTVAFSPYGYDERQFCSPGFDLPFGRLSRSSNGEYPEYHSSADDTSLLSESRLNASLVALQRIVEVVEDDRRYFNTSPKGEPQLGKRGLYGSIGGESPEARQHAMLWLLNQSDGEHSLLDIASRSGIPFLVIRDAARDLEGAGLLVERGNGSSRIAIRAKGRRRPK